MREASKQSPLHAQATPPSPTQEEGCLHLTRPGLSASGLEFSGEEPPWHYFDNPTNDQKATLPRKARACVLTNDAVGWAEENTRKGPPLRSLPA